ncbi:hypothetical protein M3Y99_00818500 [Aphelenchoides fujianensis]|nr:hypothetical protein M3Y99_00818500 [Aphelenchoides fujianensis]
MDYQAIGPTRSEPSTNVCVKTYCDKLVEIRSCCVPLWRKVLMCYIRPFRNLAQCRESFCSFFPILHWAPNYCPKSQLSGDVAAGIMSGILNITQGTPFHLIHLSTYFFLGLYATCFSSLLYPFFASWPHGTMGPFAIIQMMVGAAIKGVMETYHGENRTVVVDEEILALINPNTVSCALTLTIGLLCILCAMLHLQFLAEYFSQPLVGGFLFGATFHILVQQFDAAIGVKKPKTSGFGQLFQDLYNIWTLIPQANLTSALIAACSILFLVVFKIILHPRLERHVGKKVNISYELILVVSSTLVCYLMQLDTRQEVKVVGPIPRGLPMPAVPQFFLMQELFFEAVAIIVVQGTCPTIEEKDMRMVAGAIHMSMIKSMSQRLNYRVDDNQEIYCVGFVLTLSSFLPVYSTSNALSRPQILVECGATSQIHNFVASALVLVVLVAAGPLFYWLPMPVLAAIVIISLRNLLIRGYEEAFEYWRLSRWDFAIWAVALIATVGDNVICGLAVGVSFEMFSIVLRTQEPRWNAQFGKKDDQIDVCVFAFEAMLLFTNAERFKSAIHQVLGLWDKEENHKGTTRTFVFDCSAMVEIDSVGARALRQMMEEIQQMEIEIFFVKTSKMLMYTMEKEGAKFNPRHIFAKVDDAMAFARCPRKSISIGVADKKKGIKGISVIDFEQYKKERRASVISNTTTTDVTQ